MQDRHFLEEQRRKRLEKEFEKQFREKRVITVNGKDIPMVDVTPPELSSSTTVVAIGGFTTDPERMKLIMKEAFVEGRRVVAADYLTGDDKEIQGNHVYGADIYPKLAKRAAVGLTLVDYALQTSEALPEDKRKVDLVVGSMGELVGTMVAATRPENIRIKLSLAPAGLLGQQNWLELTKKFALEGGADMVRSVTRPEQFVRMVAGAAHSTQEIARDLGDNIDIVKETASGKINILDETEKMKHDHDIMFGLVAYTNDHLFPMHLVQKHVGDKYAQRREQNPPENQDKPDPLFDLIWSVKGGHFSLYADPKLDKQLKLVPHALKLLEQRYNKKKEENVLFRAQQSSR